MALKGLHELAACGQCFETRHALGVKQPFAKHRQLGADHAFRVNQVIRKLGLLNVVKRLNKATCLQIILHPFAFGQRNTFCLDGGTQLCFGRGEVLEPVEQSSGSALGVLLVNPGGPGASAVSTVAGMGAVLADTEIGRLAALLDHAFEDRCLHRVAANILPANRRSLALVRALGFTRDGLMRGLIEIDGAWRDHECWSMLSSEWREGRLNQTKGPASDRGRARIRVLTRRS